MPPPELRERGKAHEFSDPDRVFNARPRATRQQVPREGGHFRTGIPHHSPPANARRNHRSCFLASGVEDFASGGWTLPAAILIVRRVESERVHEPLRYGIQPARLASKRLGNLSLELLFGGRLLGRAPDALPFVSDQAIALARVDARRMGRQKPDGISTESCLDGAAVGLAVPVVEGFALRPALRAPEISDCFGQVGSERKEVCVQCHRRPGSDDRSLLRNPRERIEDESRFGACPRHVVADMRMNRSDWQTVHRECFCEEVNQAAKCLLRPTSVVAFAPVCGNQGTQQPPWLRWPCDVCFVDVPPPRRRVISAGRKAEGECEHGLLPVLDGQHT